MRKIYKNEYEIYEIRTYDNGVLQFVIGRTYKAVGTCGEAKDKEVVGVLSFSKRLNELILMVNKIPCAINERTLSYL